MNTPHRSLGEHRRRLSALADEILRLREALPRRERLLAGLAHALRAVLAASLGYWAARALGLEQGYWAAITALSVSQANYAEVRHSSRDQFVGAMIGGLVGLGAATLGHEHYLAYVLAVMVGMLACWLLNLGAAGRISGVTSTIILLVPHAGAFWQFALFRLGEVTLGATAALLVTRLFDLLEWRWFDDAPP
ncbi:aromatic acid exporter family protein [Rhodanobacter sp. Si-c]|uniref:Aromatic acid exporter family protein n=1 Tax=Rhodanobacter lycopersici TaxID=3162487 RepID=A0ABV3QE91_9GAMM